MGATAASQCIPEKCLSVSVADDKVETTKRLRSYASEYTAECQCSKEHSDEEDESGDLCEEVKERDVKFLIDSSGLIAEVESLPVLTFHNKAESTLPTGYLIGVPLSDGVEALKPQIVYTLLANASCVLVDVRDADRSAGLIQGAVHAPAVSMRDPFPAKVPELVSRFQREGLVIFFCQFSLHRAPTCANLYRLQAGLHQRVAVVEGGFRSWKAAGLPVSMEGTPLERQTADDWAKQQGKLVHRWQQARMRYGQHPGLPL